MMGVPKYERVKCREDDYEHHPDEDDAGHSVELAASNDYAEASSSLTASSPSPTNIKHSSGMRNKRNQNKGFFLNSILTTALVILLYFTLSIGLTFYQSNLLKKFPYPLTVVLYHLIIKFILSAMFRIIYRLVTGRRRVDVDCKSSLQIAPVGFASGIDIGFSNWGLELVQISLYTMTKSTTIVFILIFAILLKLEKRSWSLASIVILISGGLFMFTYKASHFDVRGFVFILIASLSSGIRWSFAQLLMQRSKLGLHHPVDMIYHMQPWMIMAIIPVIGIFEWGTIAENWYKLEESQFQDIYLMFLRITIGAILAFGMEVSEFLVLGRTSSLTLSVTGILKEICQLILAVETKGDRLSFVNVIGLILCLCGIGCHVAHKYAVFTKDNSSSSAHNGGNHNASNDSEMGPEATEAAIGFRFRTKAGNQKTLDRSPLLDTDEDEDVELFHASNGHLKKGEESPDDILSDILQRRDQRR